jgi:hypothetical protein
MAAGPSGGKPLVLCLTLNVRLGRCFTFSCATGFGSENTFSVKGSNVDDQLALTSKTDLLVNIQRVWVG